MSKKDNSPEYEASMTSIRGQRDRETVCAMTDYDRALTKWIEHDCGWLPMPDCPFEWFSFVGECMDGVFLVADDSGGRSLASVSSRFPGEAVQRDNGPDWLVRWKLNDVLGPTIFAREDSYSSEIDFIPTQWTFLPMPDTTTP